MGPTGHTIAVALLITAGVAFLFWLWYRPPKDIRAVTWRLALAFAIMFTLAPATRWGYYVYPLVLLGWLALTRRQPTTSTTTSTGMQAKATA
jgi:hypothetical protein